MVRGSLKRIVTTGWNDLRKFNLKDLSFLYLACLVTVAVVFTIFRVSQWYVDRVESRLLTITQKLEQQRDDIARVERLITQLQNPARNDRRAPRELQALVHDVIRRHEELAAQRDALARPCRDRPCRELFAHAPFTVTPAQLAKALGRPAGAVLRDLLNESLAYHAGLRDALEASLGNLQAKVRDDGIYDTIAYLSLLLLLTIQAVYLFAPAVRKLNASLSTRNEFLSRISHEIRNPMNSIIGMADILKSTRLNSEQQQYVDNLLRSGHALLDMLNNLIDFSSVEAGKLKLKSGPFDLFKSLDRCLHLMAIPAHHKNLNVYVCVNPLVTARLEGDSVRLEQVLINLLNNAVKFTEQGHVRLSVDLETVNADSEQILFSVEDTGIGIRREQLGEIFESFVQGDSSIQRRYGGSGLGLSISSELIRLMGGQLHVTSELGKGSRFFFSLRLARQAARTAAPDAPPLASLGKHEFVFLTSAQETPAYTDFFDGLGAPVRILKSASDLSAALGQNARVNQILIDDAVGIISMINCRNVAAAHGLGDQAMALLRSNFTKENMDLLRKNGFTRFLIKPLKPWELLTLPAAVEDESAVAANGPAPLLDKLKQKNLRMLLVDDSNDNLFLLREVVQPVASTVHFAENGLDALEKFGQNEYDVVFMDIQMPVMDGYTAIRKMRQMESLQGHSIPIYAVTAHAGLVDAQKCREAGFTDRIVKPVVRNDIYRSLSKAFALEHTEFEEKEPENDGGALPEKYLKRLMPTYLKTRLEDMEKLRNALGTQDFQAIAQLGHKMKGSAASYGFPRVSQKSRDLELAAQGGNLERCGQIAGELDQMFREM